MTNTLKIFTTVFLVLLTSSTQAQDTKFGLTAGLLVGSERAEISGRSDRASESGYFAGFFADIALDDRWHVQPELDYGNIASTGYGFLNVPVKFYPLKRFYLAAGPQLSYIIDGRSGSGINKLGVDAGLGLGYDFSEHIFFSARYSFGLTNRIENGSDFDYSSKLNWAHIGLGFSF